MPAKKQVTREAILDAAIQLLREKGEESLNARELARTIGCSTQPIYLSFAGMQELREALHKRISAYYDAYLAREVASGKYPPYKAYGMGYIRFAKEEKELFRYLFMCPRSEKEQQDETDEGIREIIESLAAQLHISYEQAFLFHLEQWMTVHGIATMLATSYLNWKWDMISDMLTDTYQGLRLRYIQKGAQTDGCDSN